MTSEFWDQRYSSKELVYGREPNEFLVLMSGHLPITGSALDICAGEGRNAIFLASRSLETLAVDQSAVGLNKAQTLARQQNLALRTQVADMNDFDAPADSFDVITSFFAHMPQAIRARVYQKISTWLKPGGILILEAYAPDQITRNTGGPKDPALLASLDTLLGELRSGQYPLHVEHAAALLREVHEGKFHTGQASVVQIVAKKNA